VEPEERPMDFPLVLMSFGVGILIGLTGMGGAALMAPFLILAVGLQPITRSARTWYTEP
jgi:uncharacterized protein